MPKANPFSYDQRYLTIQFVDDRGEAALVQATRLTTKIDIRIVVNLRQLWTDLENEGHRPDDFVVQLVSALREHGLDARLVRAAIVCVREHLKTKRYPVSEVTYDQVPDPRRHFAQAGAVEHAAG